MTLGEIDLIVIGMKNLNVTLENLRGNYLASEFDVKDCDLNPAKQFDLWLGNAIDSKCDDPNAFVFSTVDKNHRPHARVLLLKGIYDNEFVFYTNYESSKSKEILENSFVAMTFFWAPLARQVRVEGTIKRVDSIYSDEYFQKRPRGSQIGAIASPQSKKVSSRAELEKMFQEVEEKYQGQEYLPRPKSWGGFSVKPTYYEFWQGRTNRLHDRICYEETGTGWSLSRLAP